MILEGGSVILDWFGKFGVFHPYKWHSKLTDQPSKMTDPPSKITDPPSKINDQPSKLSILKIIHSFNHFSNKQHNYAYALIGKGVAFFSQNNFYRKFIT